MKRVAHSLYHMFFCSLSICYFGYFPFWFRGRDFGSDCSGFWSFLTFVFLDDENTVHLCPESLSVKFFYVNSTLENSFLRVSI